MTTETIWDCSLGLSDETLSAWRDRALPPAEVQRIAGHVAGCPACRTRLDTFEALAAAIRAERPPHHDAAQLWHGVSQRIATNGGRSGGAGGGNRVPPRLWGTLAAVAAIVLVALGFAQLFGRLGGHVPGLQPTPTVSPHTTPTITPAPSTLHWQQAIYPPGPHSNGMPRSATDQPPTIDPGNGNSAYLCDSTSNPQDHEQVWRTQNFAAPNRGAQWTRLGDLPIASSALSTCAILVDTTDSATLVAVVEPVALPDGSGGVPILIPRDYASFDSGATWQQLPQPVLVFNFSSLATYQGKIYAIVSFGVSQDHQIVPSHLVTSSDHMRTWQTLDPQTQLQAFWLNPASGALLALDMNREYTASNDGGQTWTAPTTAGWPDQFAVRPPAAGAPWTICGRYSATSAPFGPQLRCATASQTGQPLSLAWRTLPALPGAAQRYDPQLLAVTSDGSVLATYAQTAGNTSNAYPLFRLAPGSQNWTPLGTLPQFSVVYGPGALLAQPLGAATDFNDYVAAYP